MKVGVCFQLKLISSYFHIQMFPSGDEVLISSQIKIFNGWEIAGAKEIFFYVFSARDRQYIVIPELINVDNKLGRQIRD